jgi:uncharacterized protein
MDDIELVIMKDRDLKGAHVIDGFPSVGLVGSITANYLVSLLGLEQIGFIDSPHFPNVSVIREGKPYHPVRIYAGELEDDEKIVVFVSEFQPSTEIVKQLASRIMDWIEEKGCAMVISPEGLTKGEEAQGLEERKDIKVYGVASTLEGLEAIKALGIETFEAGVIVGLAGALLNQGIKRGFNVVSLLSEANSLYPDARSAAAVTSVIDRILLHVELDTAPLLEEAALIENSLKDLYKKAGKGEDISNIRPIMYG